LLKVIRERNCCGVDLFAPQAVIAIIIDDSIQFDDKRDRGCADILVDATYPVVPRFLGYEVHPVWDKYSELLTQYELAFIFASQEYMEEDAEILHTLAGRRYHTCRSTYWP
jgi:hypothetical protein